MANAPVAELADAPDLGSGIFDVQVQALSGAPHQHNPNLLFSEGFGFFCGKSENNIVVPIAKHNILC